MDEDGKASEAITKAHGLEAAGHKRQKQTGGRIQRVSRRTQRTGVTKNIRSAANNISDAFAFQDN